MSKKIKFLAANLLAPGIGLFAMKKWKRGAFYFSGTAICFIWLLTALVHKLKALYTADMETPDSAFSSTGIVIALFIPIGMLVFLWVFSFIDICLFCKVPAKPDSRQ